MGLEKRFLAAIEGEEREDGVRSCGLFLEVCMGRVLAFCPVLIDGGVWIRLPGERRLDELSKLPFYSC